MIKYSDITRFYIGLVKHYLPRRITSKRVVEFKITNKKPVLKIVEKHTIKVNKHTLFTSENKLFHSDRVNIISKYFSWIQKLETRMSETSDNVNESIFEPPTCTKGMKVLDKSAFKKSCKLPGFKIPNTLVGKISKMLKHKLVKIPRLKPIALLDKNDPQKDTHKMFLFNPNEVRFHEDLSAEERLILSDSEIDYKKLEWFDVELGYENWTVAEIIRAILPDDIQSSVTGFSTIGHIAHLNLKDVVLDYKHILGEVILDKHKPICTVVNKLNTIDNTYRNFQMELLAGEELYVTTAKENGCSFEFDFSKVYWNSRLGSEHKRLVDLLNRGDNLYDVFAGVGPFSILAAKKAVTVFANDLNPESFRALEKNISLNKITSSLVRTYNMDGREFIKTIVKDDLIKRLCEIPSNSSSISNTHIVMNLPALALEFLDTFKLLFATSEITDITCKRTIEQNLPTVHCYCFSKSEDVEKDVEERAENILGMKLPADHVVRFVRNVAPNKNMMCLTFKLMPYLVFSESNEPDAKKQKLAN